MAKPPTPKPWISAIHAYVPGKSAADDGTRLIKLSANENPLGTSQKALEARGSLPQPALYPDPDSAQLREALGELHEIDPALIICGTGSGELLNIAAQAYAGPGDEVLFTRFGFSLYEIIARKCGATPVEAADADFATDVDALLALVDKKTKVIFLANPNNPTGTFLSAAELARLHAALPSDILLVLDQAYAEYVADENDDGSLQLAAQFKNVLVTRTFSKAYGLAGERVGWATGDAQLISILNRLRGPFNLSHSAQATALAALGDQDFVSMSRQHNAAERTRFATAIEAMGNHGLRAIASEANFVLIMFEGALSAEDAHKGLAKIGYAVRHLPGQGLPQALRITIGTSQQMDDVANALRQMAEEAQ